MATRAEVIQLVKDGKMSREDAAAALHLTPTRIGQLVKELGETGAVTEAKTPKEPSPEPGEKPKVEESSNHPFLLKKAPMPGPVVVVPGMAQPAQPKAGAPASLKDAIEQARGGKPPDATGAKPPPLKVTAQPITDAEAEFGREILTAGREGMVDNIAEYAFDLDPNDADLQPVRKGGRLWNLAVKANPTLAGSVGRAGSGLVGAIVFGILECLSIARACRRVAKKKPKSEEEKAKTPEPPKLAAPTVEQGAPVAKPVLPKDVKPFSLKKALSEGS